MLNVLDEKWKDHLYDLDQLRAAIHYRSWGQKDPLIEYKQEAYTMFVDLMHDIHTTFTERFLRAQLVFEPPPPPPPDRGPSAGDGAPLPRKRYNALGILEEVPEVQPSGYDADVRAERAGAGVGTETDGDGQEQVMDVAPDEPPKTTVAARQDPMVVGAGRARKLSEMGGGTKGARGVSAGEIDWSSVGRNDPCPCGSGKKFKKCHGANA
jgi:preprotein translocase subunit SecA